MIETVSGLLALLQSHGATRFYVKKLASNDNSKNQIYLGGDFSALNIIPHQTVYIDAKMHSGSKRDRAKAKINFLWVDENELNPAPYAQLVLYPKYPEIRMSGFLKECKNAPSDVMTVRDEGRVLILGVTREGLVLGYAAGKNHPIAKEILARRDLQSNGVFLELVTGSAGVDTRSLLLARLEDIYRKHWIPSQKLGIDGQKYPYRASNGGGYTLEAELGISPNGFAEPDFLGWEIKQYGVRDFKNFNPKSPVTLMTPEPTDGIYRDKGVDVFIHRFGYTDTSGKPDRLNFGGIYDCTKTFHVRTSLQLKLKGYDFASNKITDIEGGIALVSRHDEVAALWKFTRLIEHWNRKHAKAAYVPSLFRKPPPEYRYGPRILLCEKTEFSLLLKALASGTVYYDPGIKMEKASSANPRIKRRSQFRVKHSNLVQLYHAHENITLHL